MTHFVLFATITAVAAKNSVGSPPDGIYPNAKKDNYIWAKRPGLISPDFLLFMENLWTSFTQNYKENIHP